MNTMDILFWMVVGYLLHDMVGELVRVIRGRGIDK